jgi:hypothetical protein
MEDLVSWLGVGAMREVGRAAALVLVEGKEDTWAEGKGAGGGSSTKDDDICHCTFLFLLPSMDADGS